jgi:hypothetical protein
MCAAARACREDYALRAAQFQEPVGASQRSRAGYFDYSIDVKTLPSGQRWSTRSLRHRCGALGRRRRLRSWCRGPVVPAG